MQLVSKFLSVLNGNFEASNVKKAFYETNKLYLSPKTNANEENIADLLDACQEFFPLSFLMEDENYSKLYKHLMSVSNTEFQFPLESMDSYKQSSSF